MYSSKNIFIFSLFAVAICWTLMPLHPKENSYPVQGFVKALSGEVDNAKIKYTQDIKNNNFADMKEISVRSNGTFSQNVYALPNTPVYFYVIKDGYTTSMFFKRLAHTDKINNIGTIKISTLHETLSYAVLEDNSKAPRLHLFDDDCLDKPNGNINVTHINFFENLTKLTSPSCLKDDPRVLYSAKVNIEGHTETGKKVYFGLIKQADGTTIIADLYKTAQGVSTSPKARR